MKRQLIMLVAVLALFAAACGDAVGSDPVATTETPPSSVAQTGETTSTPAPAPTATQAPEGNGTTAPTEAPAPPPKVVEGPPAPDFTLALADNRGQFVLSDEQKPVYMVFWAEW